MKTTHKESVIQMKDAFSSDIMKAKQKNGKGNSGITS